MEEIKQFIENRPNVIAAYAYGSKVFKQNNADIKSSLIDLIFVVEDIKKWHLENLKKNPNDYSLMGSTYFKIANKEKLKGNTGIAYISDIEENGLRYKFGTIEYQDLLLYLQTWKSFYMAGRFQKTISPYKEDVDLNRAILINRKKAILVASLLQNKNIVDKHELFETLVSLSYMGDPRMKLGEAPNKIKNIVNGSFDEYNNIYNINTNYLSNLGDKVSINKDNILKEYNNLPLYLKEYIDNSNEDIINNNIINYLSNLNNKEGWAMMLKGPKTNGVSRSLKYGARKVKKKFEK